MIYKDFERIVKKVIEVRQYKVQALTIILGSFLALLVSALFEGSFWIIIEAISLVCLGILVLHDKKSMINLSENGPMKEVHGKEAVKWGLYYVFFGIILTVFYYFS